MHQEEALNATVAFCHTNERQVGCIQILSVASCSLWPPLLRRLVQMSAIGIEVIFRPLGAVKLSPLLYVGRRSCVSGLTRIRHPVSAAA